MAGGGGPISTGQEIDAEYLYSEEFYVDAPPEKFSCPVCLCPVQRAAHLTQCCGNHFCLACIDRVRRDGKPCPICKGQPVYIFPNKERQREINQLKVLCPLRGEEEEGGRPEDFSAQKFGNYSILLCFELFSYLCSHKTNWHFNRATQLSKNPTHDS